MEDFKKRFVVLLYVILLNFPNNPTLLLDDHFYFSSYDLTESKIL